MVDDTRFLLTMRDVTEAKRAEQRERHVEMQRIQSAAQRAIEEAKAACDTLQKLDLASDLVTHMEIKNGTTTLLYCSASYEAVLGHQPKTCVGNVDGSDPSVSPFLSGITTTGARGCVRIKANHRWVHHGNSLASCRRPRNLV